MILEKPLCDGRKELCSLGDFTEDGKIGIFSAKKEKCKDCWVFKTLVKPDGNAGSRP